MNNAGLYVVPNGKRKPSVIWAGMRPDRAPVIEIQYIGNDGAIQYQRKKWNHKQTTEEIDAWMEKYFQHVRNGYIPQGFNRAPMPFYARITVGPRVKATWESKETSVKAG